MVENSLRRDELLEKIVAVLLDEGVAELSLRPLAEKVGSSARLLIYHFGTKEELVKCALDIVHERAEQSLQALAAQKRPANMKASLLIFWEWAVADFNQRYFRLMFEADGLAMHRKNTLAGDFRDEGGLMWRRMIERITQDLPNNKRTAGRATLIMAALNGLLQDFFLTGDHGRVKAGLQYLIRLVAEDEALEKPRRP
jgi:AcrR family transcriptional regulator